MPRLSSRLSRAPLSRALRSLGRELPGIAPAVVVVALILCLLLPLPTPIIDLLLSLSLAAAVVLVIAVLRVRRAAEFLAFPTLVLLLTLYRLALNVSTTRLILAQADAGRVVDAFAQLVVRGDLLIGAVMFAVIMVVQYFVIARGAERVAEVAARFTLDGMPGQQQAIEADLRSGAISPREAQARRAALSERSDLFGRMDGVMRWVKGDALVGLLITGLNLLGGVALGSVRGGLAVAESLALYGGLAIGDGLLTQLPALLIALAAAVLVARVDRVREHQGQGQTWLEPVMLLVPAALLGLLALVPGMPTLAFATTTAGLIASALVIASRRSVKDHEREPAIQVRVGVSGETRTSLARALTGIRRRCEAALAIPLPKLLLQLDGPILADKQLELRYGERVLGRRQATPAPGVSELDALLLCTYQLLIASAHTLVTLEQIELELELCRRRHPSLVHQAMRVLEPGDVLAIVRAFVRERIPVPSMTALVQILAERRVFRDASQRPQWPELVREALADHWLRDLLDGVSSSGCAQWIRPTVDLEDLLLARAVRSEAGVQVSLSPAEQASFVARVQALAPGGPAILVCSNPARQAIASVLMSARPQLPVLSVGELLAAKVELPATLALDLE